MGSNSGCVQLGCSKVSSGKTDHRMDPALQSRRIKLTKWLEAQEWFDRHVQPFRETMQYAAPKDGAIALSKVRSSERTAGCAVQYWTQARGWVCDGKLPPPAKV